MDDSSLISHKPLFPMDVTDLLGASCIFLAIFVNTLVGLGETGIILPTLIFIMGFPIRRAIALSILCVFSSNFATSILNFHKKIAVTQNRTEHLVYWPVIMIMEPIALVGSFVGSFCAKVVPEFILSVTLSIVLGSVAVRTIQHGHEQCMQSPQASLIQGNLSSVPYKTESFEEEEEKVLRDQSSMVSTYSDLSFEEEKGGRQETPSRSEKELQQILQKEQKLPWEDLLAFVLLNTVILGLTLLKTDEGSSDVSSFVECGGIAYWIDTLLIVLVLAFFSISYHRFLRERFRKKILFGYVPCEEEPEIVLTNTPQLSLLYIIAGIIAGSFGLGGGMMKEDLMIATGINPQRASATSLVMVTFTSLSIIISYVVFGSYSNVEDYAFGLFIIGLSGALFGNFLLSKDFATGYMVSFTIASLVGLSSIFLMGESVTTIIAVFLTNVKSNDEGFISLFGSLCSRL